MIRAALLDDERIIVDDLAAQLASRANWRVTGAFTDYRKAVAHCRDERPDILFLDIEMPGSDGLSVARDVAAMGGARCFVFVTAHPQYAAEAYRLDAIDYLVKPLGARLLAEACARAEERLKALGPDAAARNLEDLIAVRSARRVEFVSIDQIILAKGAGNYVALISADGERLHRMPLQEFEQLAGSRGFVRTHRSYLANLKYIQSAELSGGLSALRLAHGLTAPVSAAYRRSVEAALAGRVLS